MGETVKKFHVGKNGPGPCHATKRACRYGPEVHFTTEAEAEAAYAKTMEEEQGGSVLKSATRGQEKSSLAKRLETMAPHEIDLEAVPYFEKQQEILLKQEAAQSRYLQAKKAEAVAQKRFEETQDPRYPHEGEAARREQAKARAAYAALEEPLAQVTLALAPYEAEHERRGYNRVYISMGAEGHVHKAAYATGTDGCPTLHREGKRTPLSWLPQYSGRSEEEIVKEAGWRACTKCYPSAPLGTQASLPSSIRTKDDEDREERRRARAEAATVKAKKTTDNAISMPGGEPLVVEGREVRTYREAKQKYVETFDMEEKHKATVENRHNWKGQGTPQSIAWAKQLLEKEQEKRKVLVEALAHKEGVTPEEYEAQEAPAMEKRRKQAVKNLAKAAEEYKASNPELFNA